MTSSLWKTKQREAQGQGSLQVWGQNRSGVWEPHGTSQAPPSLLVLSQSLGRDPARWSRVHAFLIKGVNLCYSSPRVYCQDPATEELSLMRHICWVIVSFSEKAMAPHSSTLAWKIPWMEEPGGLQSMGSLRVGHDWAASLSLFTFMHWRRKWQPTPVFLPGESQGRASPVGCHLWGHTESDTTEAP